MTMNIKGVPLNALPEEAWQYLVGSPDSVTTGITGIAAYQRVPWIYRATRLRSGKMAALPFTLTRNDDDTDLSLLPEYQALMGKLRMLIQRNEAALCIYGAAYNVLETNRFGMRRSLRWLLPPSIQPVIDPEHGLTAFTRSRGQQQITMPLFDPAKPRPGQLLWYWEPNIAGEDGPGQSVAYAALRKANALDKMDAAVQQFFERGMIRATILTVEGNPPQAEMTKLEAWWKRLFSGVKGAWNTAAFRAQVKPQVIGDGLEAVSNTALSDDQVESIIATFGVPMSLMLSNAANYATAVQDALAMYTNTIIPQWDAVHSEPLNAFLSLDGLRLSVDTSRIEEYQSHQLETAEQITKLVGMPVMTIDEGRAWLGLPPLERTQMIAPPPSPAPTPEPPAPTAEENTTPDGEPALPDNVRADLDRWRTKALKRLREGKAAAVGFDSAAIPPLWRTEITAGLRGATTSAAVRAVFHSVGHIRAISDLTPEERRIYNAILPVLRASTDPAAQAILSGASFDLSALGDDLQMALIPVLTDLYAQTFMTLPPEIPVETEMSEDGIVNETARQWATEYTYDLVRGINSTTQSALQQIFDTFNSTPGMTRGELEQMIAPLFGPVRASMIAVTETTRTAAAATNAQQVYLRDQGFNLIRVWNTNADDLVCPICGPLNGRPESEWGATVGSPPAHVNCRCSVVLREIDR